MLKVVFIVYLSAMAIIPQPKPLPSDLQKYCKENPKWCGI